MGKRDLPGKAEADAAPALVRGVKGQEYVFAPLRGNAGAIVANLNPVAPARLPID